MIVRRLIIVGALCAGLLPATSTPLKAQHPVDGIEWMMANLRPHGQPVIPIFEGWYQKPDGTYDLCFGYFNLNLEETLEIPLGPGNFIEPAEFDGNQPSMFLPVPPPPNRYRRHFCTFVVNVPEDHDGWVVWTLEHNGQAYSVPGHLEEPAYGIEEVVAVGRRTGRETDGLAPVVRFVEPEGSEGIGRSGIWSNPVTVAVGEPLTLSVALSPPDQDVVIAATGMDLLAMDRSLGSGSGVSDEPDDDASDEGRQWWVHWSKHQGPVGNVTITPREQDVFVSEGVVTAVARFSQPGDYILRMQGIDNPGEGGSYQFHCCWTNAYVAVTVTP